MPDIGGIGRGLLKGALTATEKAAEKVKDAAEAASRRISDDAETPQVVTRDLDAPQVVTTDPDATLAVTDAGPEPDPEITQVIKGAPGRRQNTATGTLPPAAPPAGAGAGQPGVPLLAATTTAPPVGERPAPDGPPPSSAVQATREEPALDDESEDRADSSDVREFVEMFHQLLARRRPPAGPIQDEWSVGVGDLLGEHPRVPKRIRGVVGKLNRFGGLSYSPREVAFDGDDVPWEKVTEVRTRHVVDYLVGDAVQQQVENLPIPWFPGRGRLLDALGQALLTATIVTAKKQLERLDLDQRIPAEIVYKASFGRSKELNAGVVSALVLADPAVNQSLVATARARGIRVTTGDDELLADADERAEQIRQKVKALEMELDRFTRRFGRKG